MNIAPISLILFWFTNVSAGAKVEARLLSAQVSAIKLLILKLFWRQNYNNTHAYAGQTEYFYTSKSPVGTHGLRPIILILCWFMNVSAVYY
jgi:hypothetical protein